MQRVVRRKAGELTYPASQPVVVALVHPADLVTPADHRHTLREQEQRYEVSLLATFVWTVLPP